MLETVEHYRKAFDAMSDEDIQYARHFDEDKGRSGQPINYDWENIWIFIEFLRLFYEVTYTIFWSLYVTSTEYCQQVCQVKEQLDEMYENVDSTLQKMALSIRLKYEKYWDDLNRINVLLYMAIVLNL